MGVAPQLTPLLFGFLFLASSSWSSQSAKKGKQRALEDDFGVKRSVQVPSPVLAVPVANERTALLGNFNKRIMEMGRLHQDLLHLQMRDILDRPVEMPIQDGESSKRKRLHPDDSGDNRAEMLEEDILRLVDLSHMEQDSQDLYDGARPKRRKVRWYDRRL